MTQKAPKVAVVTGAGSGIGRALAQQLAREGWVLALCDIDEAGLAETTQGITVPLLVERLDVADREAVFSLAERVSAELGRADLIINNAGVALADTIEAMKYEDFEWLMGINFWGVVHGCKAFLPILRAQGSGHLVNISSSFGLISLPTQGAYNAAKFAVRGFTECLRQELAGTGIGVTCVHPGGIKTNIVRNARIYRGLEGERDRNVVVAQFDKVARTTPERAAEVILAGVAKKKNRVLIGKDAFLMDWAARLFPRSYERILNAMIRHAKN